MKHGLTDGRRVVLITKEDLRGGVGERPAARLQPLTGVELVGEAEVGQLDEAQLLEEDHVLGLEVAVDHVQAVAVLKSLVKIIDDLNS